MLFLYSNILSFFKLVCECNFQQSIAMAGSGETGALLLITGTVNGTYPPFLFLHRNCIKNLSFKYKRGNQKLNTTDFS